MATTTSNYYKVIKESDTLYKIQHPPDDPDNCRVNEEIYDENENKKENCGMISSDPTNANPMQNIVAEVDFSTGSPVVRRFGSGVNNSANNLGNNSANNSGNNLGNNSSNNSANNLGNNSGNNSGNNLGNNSANNLGNNSGNNSGNNLGNNSANNLGNNSGNNLGNTLLNTNILSSSAIPNPFTRSLSDIQLQNQNQNQNSNPFIMNNQSQFLNQPKINTSRQLLSTIQNLTNNDPLRKSLIDNFIADRNNFTQGIKKALKSSTINIKTTDIDEFVKKSFTDNIIENVILKQLMSTIGSYVVPEATKTDIIDKFFEKETKIEQASRNPNIDINQKINERDYESVILLLENMKAQNISGFNDLLDAFLKYDKERLYGRIIIDKLYTRIIPSDRTFSRRGYNIMALNQNNQVRRRRRYVMN